MSTSRVLRSGSETSSVKPPVTADSKTGPGDKNKGPEPDKFLPMDASNLKMPGPKGSQYEWGVYHSNLIKTLNHNIGVVNMSVDTLKSVSAKADSAHIIATDNQKRLNIVETDVKSLKKDNIQLKRDNAMLKEKTLKFECYQYKDNLIIDGIPDSVTEDTKQLLVDNISKIPDLEFDETMIVQCNRLGRYKENVTRSIKCTIISKEVKLNILKGKKHLPKDVYVNEHFPTEINQRRKQLYPIFKRALSLDHYKGKVFLNADKLIVNTKVFTVEPVNNLNSLPLDLQPRSLCEKSNDDTLVFFGRHSPFSNFHACEFRIDNISYCCSEQYIQGSKAQMFDDEVAQHRIMISTEPSKMKTIGKRIRNFNQNTWKNAIPRVAKTALFHNFLKILT